MPIVLTECRKCVGRLRIHFILENETIELEAKMRLNDYKIIT